MPLRRLLPLLTCPLCSVNRGRSPLPLLSNPFTLHCGHTVCSSHLETLDPTQRCPLPVCSSTPNQNTAHPNAPSTSRVIYLPAAPPSPSSRQAATPSTDQNGQKVDITVRKLIEVVSRHSPPLVPSNLGDYEHFDEEDNHAHLEQSPVTSSDEETRFRAAGGMRRSSGLRRRRTPELAAIPNHSDSTLQSSSPTSLVSADSVGTLPSSSGHAGDSAGGEISDGSDLGPEPPKKRLRCNSRALATDRRTQSCAIEPEGEAGNPDDPNHTTLFQQPPNRPGAEHLRDPEDLRTRIDKELLTELCCEICFGIYYQPVTTPCQHTFCGRCLRRSLDHSSHCPVCRTDLPDYVYIRDIPQNKVILAIEFEAFPKLYAERQKLIEEEERNARLDTPLFVCQLSFPGVPTNLHFFEPRYRLMLRRCLESPTPRFGMIMPPKSGSSNANVDFGTMLEIRTVRVLPDGRSLVHTWGVSRFRILERGTLDGYMVGRIEYIEDFPEELEDTLDAALEEKAALEAETQNLIPPPAPGRKVSRAPSPVATQTLSVRLLANPLQVPQLSDPHTDPHLLIPTNEALMNKCRAFVEQIREGAAPWVVQKLNDFNKSYGNMPTDASKFSFWVALVLPIEDYEKAKLLPIRSARLRLKLVAHWIDQLNGNWWFSNGCVVC